MIILDLKADNLFAFNDFHINFTYPKKIINSTIEDECLSYCPSFRYKKFILVMGANASGKTALGKLIMSILNFISRKEYSAVTYCINDTGKNASFTLDFISDTEKMYRITTEIKASNSYISSDIRTNVYYTEIKNGDNYEKCSKRIEEMKENNNGSYISELEKIDKLSWMFKFTDKEEQITTGNIIDEKRFIKTLEMTLKVLDPRILGVRKVPDANNMYTVHFPHGKYALINNGKVESDLLSSGTREGISIAHLIASIKQGIFKFYYCDEKLSHIHSDSERAFISLMIDCLKKDNQLIMTSHNSDLLEMQLPKHSYAFLKRDKEYDIKCVYASDFLKRNTDSIRCAVENDVFGTSPNVDDIYRLKELPYE